MGRGAPRRRRDLGAGNGSPTSRPRPQDAGSPLTRTTARRCGRLRHLALERAAGVVGVGAHAGARARPSLASTAGRSAGSSQTTKTSSRARARASRRGHDHALDAGGPADARGGRAADLLDQVVVAAARADARPARRRAPRSRTRTPCACSSRARGRASARARSRRRRRRGRRAPRAKCSRQAAQSESPIVGALGEHAADGVVLRVEDAQRAHLGPARVSSSSSSRCSARNACSRST